MIIFVRTMHLALSLLVPGRCYWLTTEWRTPIHDSARFRASLVDQQGPRPNLFYYLCNRDVHGFDTYHVLKLDARATDWASSFLVCYAA